MVFKQYEEVHKIAFVSFDRAVDEYFSAMEAERVAKSVEAVRRSSCLPCCGCFQWAVVPCCANLLCACATGARCSLQEG